MKSVSESFSNQSIK